jgi:hypothetical protein
MVLLTEDCMALTVRMMVPLFWTTSLISQCFINHSTNTSHCSETTDSVPDIVHIGIEAQQGVCAALCACDMTMFSVAYVSGFIAKHLLNNSNVTYVKNKLVFITNLMHNCFNL